MPTGAHSLSLALRRGGARSALPLAFAVAFCCAPPVLAQAPAGASAAQPQLPEEPPPIPPLRRDANGQIEVISPESERAAGRPLCEARALCVGEGQTYPTLAAALAAAHPGDIVNVIGGTYREAARVAVPRVIVRGTAGRPHFDCAALDLSADGAACIDIAADGVKLDNLEVSGAAARGAACIRSEGESSLELSDIFCHDSATGIVADGGTITILHAEFYDNGGTRDGANAAFGSCASLRIIGSVFRDAHAGDELLSRCAKTEVSDTRFVSSEGGLALDFPDGGDAMVFRSRIEKTIGSTSDEIVAFATRSCDNPGPGTLALKEVGILNSRPGALIANGNRCKAGAVTLQDVVVRGVPVATRGYIVDFGGNQLAPGLVPPPPPPSQGAAGPQQ